MKNFPTVHTHPESLDSGSTPAAFAQREIELGTGVLTVTDHGYMGACPTVYNLAKEKKLTPILGVEGYFRDDNCPILTEAGIPKLHPKKKMSKELDYSKPESFAHYVKYNHLTIHSLDQEAYETCGRLLSLAPVEVHGSEAKPLFNWAAIEEIGSKNTTITTGCLIGMVQRFLVDHNDPIMAEKYYLKLKSLVKPGNFYVEIFPHDCSKNWVSGVFLELIEGDSITRQKYSDTKWFRTNLGEIQAGELAKEFHKGGHKRLLGVKNYQTWSELNQVIKSVQHISDFMPNECRPWAEDGDLQKGANLFMLGLAKKHKDPIVIADDSHYANKDEKVVQDVRLLQGGKDSWRFYGSYHRQSSQEAFTHFVKTMGTSQDEFEGWVENNIQWAGRFKDFKLTYKPSIPASFYPNDTLRHTMDLIKKHGRMDWKNKAYIARLKQEIELLHQNGKIDLLPYFFIDEEVCARYEANNELVGVGRGSSAGLLMNYLLGITHIDPLEFNLSLDRFLTLDRIESGKLPDIDQDLPHRDLLVCEGNEKEGWLQQRFGDSVAQISTPTSLRLKAAIKDVCRMTRGKVPPEVEGLTVKMQSAPQGVSDKEFVFGYKSGEEFVQGSIETDKALQEFVKNYPNEWEIVKKTLGVKKSTGRHASAYVIADQPLHNFIPTQYVSGVKVTQYNMGGVEEAGGVKMDFLNLNTLKDLAGCIKLIQANSGLDIPESMVLEGKRVPKIRLVPHNGEYYDIWKLWVSPYAKEVFKDVAMGKTETVFQFNTPSAKQWLKHFNYEKAPGTKLIDSVDTMAIFTALDRPGPLDAFVSDPEDPDKQHNMLVEYTRRARGLPKSPDIPQLFDELFPETYGLMVTQEQLQKIYQGVTGCTGAEAEAFRSLVAKKKMDKILKKYEAFIEGATKRMGTREAAQAVWDKLVSWSAYGFNYSHAVCYANTGLACAYLKKYFPLEWWTSVLQNASKDDINEKFWSYCSHLVDPPDVSLSGAKFQIRNGRIKAPLSLIHGIGPGAHEQLVKYAPYTDIQDFCNKIQLHKESTATETKEIITKKEKTKILGADGKPIRKDKKFVYQEREFQVEVTKRKLGTSALKRNIVHSLILVGAMDSLFPPNTGVVDQLQLFEEALAKATDKKIEPLPDSLMNIDAISRYQTKKRYLASYSDRLEAIIEPYCEEIKLDQGRYYLFDGEYIPFETPSRIERLEGVAPWPDDLKIKVAIAGYVLSHSTFKWSKASGSGEGSKFLVEFGGKQREFVFWSDKNKRLPELYREDWTGAVVVMVLYKGKEGKPFSLNKMIPIRAGLEAEKEE